MTREIAPVKRYYGSEVEYGYTQRGDAKGIFITAQDLDLTSPRRPRIGQFLGNGGRRYQDRQVLEYATPECESLKDLVLHEIAGERLILEWVTDSHGEQPAMVAGITALHKRAVDFHGKYTYGAHENYSTSVNVLNKSEAFRLRTLLLATHFATRTIYTGAGFYHPMKGYAIGQKMSGISKFKGTETTVDKPLVNLRSEDHDEPGSTKRLHVICGDANISPWAIQMKFGTTSLVLRLLEHRFKIDPNWMLHDPVHVARNLAEGVDRLNSLYETQSGELASAIDIQEHIYNLCVAMSEKIEIPKDELMVLDHWGEVLSSLHNFADTGEYDPILMQIDWFARLKTMERSMERKKRDFPNDKRQFEAVYDMLPNGTGYGLRSNGRIFSPHTPSEDEIRNAMKTAPNGRARLRSKIIAMSGKNFKVSMMNWGSAMINDKILRMPLHGDYSDEGIKKVVEEASKGRSRF